MSAVIRRASALATCCADVTTQVTTTAALETLRTTTTATMRAAVLEALTELLVRHCHTPRSGHPVLPAPTALAGELAAAWDAATADATLDDTIATATRDGLDGELICWDVISVESLDHIGLIRKEASKLVRKMRDTASDDLMGYGWSGLRSALRAYNPDLGFAFSTYACPRINGAIRDGVRGENPLPKRLTTLVRAAATAEEILTQQLARTPTYAEIIAYLDAEADHVELLPRLSAAASLDELTDPWRESAREPACLIDAADPADDALRTLRVEAVRSAIHQLPADQAQVVTMLYLEERSLTETSRLLGVDTKTLRAAKRQGMAALAEALRDWQSPVLVGA